MTESTEWAPQDIEFAEARTALHGHPNRQSAFAAARMALAAEGHDRPWFRDLTVRAAAILAEQAAY
jgi:hypothetical protein